MVENITQFCWKYSSSFQQWKNFENRLRFEKVIANSLVASFFWNTVYFVLVSCARLSWSHSAFESTLNSSIVLYRIVILGIFFANRVIHIWNSLPDSVIEANSVNSFKNRLEIYWNNFEFKYNWKADLTGPEAVVKVF